LFSFVAYLFIYPMNQLHKHINRIVFYILISILFRCLPAVAQNTGFDNLLTAAQWDLLFPKRAGTFGVHPQGYTADFFSFANLKQAVDEISDYEVEIRIKEGVWGQLITVTRKSTGLSYLYSDVSPDWHTNPTLETIAHVDFLDFVNRSSSENNKRELAAFLANISKETTGGWQLPVGGGTDGDYALWGLYFVHELGYTSSNSAGVYSATNLEFPPNPAVGYYGRGPIQLSWNYNYGQFSKFMFNDKNILLDNPDLVQSDGVLAFKSAIWFWMMPQCPKPSCHMVMHDLWIPDMLSYSASKMYQKGFAHTNNIINGGLECRSTSAQAFTDKVFLRSELYKYYLGILGFDASQIAAENLNGYSTLCYESETNAMEDYVDCQLDNMLGSIENNTEIVQIFPNPTSKNLQLGVSEDLLGASYEIYDNIGKKVMTDIIQSQHTFISIEKLPEGIYFLTIDSARRPTFRIVKQ
jgi:hypothetical protein